ncbi:helix-turn-helix transcriptional regulator [Clostridioides difficile]|uniref:helix-turn-helix transcriptional regulator n=1 Tax=Clostridioides difficile TaxID=1496 RepID=UPI000E9FA88E|nr:helix-turn-helix transcriptional regulator [Clostridioides difficile]AXU76956.1 transcriptional regulator [Clostridioides difficile]MCM4145073.1 helix-turn-helix transcriptional regulator [Clostridioides difficile]MDU2175320.1 helix-turn-helix transcriptional regulator [Clostridioides difficile]VHX76679.1 transcriptional regulator [Clostridioides difficile]VHY46787.1 transcriptional regulator [Clostridioides difficile]
MAILMKTKIKEYREKLLMTQNELVKSVGVKHGTIVHLENGKYNLSLKLAMDIAKVFNTTIKNLFEFIEEE